MRRFGHATDAELVQAARAGERPAFSVLVERYATAVEGIALTHAGDADEARDLAQEAFVRAWSTLGQLREPTKFGAWLLALTQNLCRTWLRRRKSSIPWQEPTLSEVESVGPAPDPTRAHTSAALKAAIASLPGKTRAAVVLHYADGYSLVEIGRSLDLSPAAVKARLHYARRRLQQRLLCMMPELVASVAPSPESTTKAVMRRIARYSVTPAPSTTRRQRYILLGDERGCPVRVAATPLEAFAVQEALFADASAPPPTTGMVLRLLKAAGASLTEVTLTTARDRSLSATAHARTRSKRLSVRGQAAALVSLAVTGKIPVLAAEQLLARGPRRNWPPQPPLIHPEEWKGPVIEGMMNQSGIVASPDPARFLQVDLPKWLIDGLGLKAGDRVRCRINYPGFATHVSRQVLEVNGEAVPQIPQPPRVKPEQSLGRRPLRVTEVLPVTTLGGSSGVALHTEDGRWLRLYLDIWPVLEALGQLPPFPSSQLYQFALRVLPRLGVKVALAHPGGIQLVNSAGRTTMVPAGFPDTIPLALWARAPLFVSRAMMDGHGHGEFPRWLITGPVPVPEVPKGTKTYRFTGTFLFAGAGWPLENLLKTAGPRGGPWRPTFLGVLWGLGKRRWERVVVPLALGEKHSLCGGEVVTVRLVRTPVAHFPECPVACEVLAVEPGAPRAGN